jgi:hypothetical protein
MKKLKKSVPSPYQLIRTGADGYLQAQFNIFPLLSDIAGVKSAIQNTLHQINKLRQREGKRNTRHFTENLRDVFEDNEDTTDYVIPDGSFVGSNRARRYVYHTDPKFVASIQYSYSLPGLPEHVQNLAGLLDALGVNLTPKIIWNAIPWSFVVDWVLGVNQAIDRFGTRNLEPVVNIHKFCYSVKVQRSVSTSIELGHDSPVGPSVWQSVCTVNEKAYVRKNVYLDADDLYRSLSLSGLSPKEFSLAGALFASRIKKH